MHSVQQTNMSDLKHRVQPFDGESLTAIRKAQDEASSCLSTKPRAGHQVEMSRPVSVCLKKPLSSRSLRQHRRNTFDSGRRTQPGTAGQLTSYLSSFVPSPGNSLEGWVRVSYVGETSHGFYGPSHLACLVPGRWEVEALPSYRRQTLLLDFCGAAECVHQIYGVLLDFCASAFWHLRLWVLDAPPSAPRQTLLQDLRGAAGHVHQIFDVFFRSYALALMPHGQS